MSGYLFGDVSAGAPEDARKGRRSKKTVRASLEAQKPAERILEAPRAIQPVEFLGRCDEGFVCGDATCRGTAGDIVGEDDGWWLVACCVCCTMIWLEAKRPLEGSEREFRFRGGQYDGQTLPEVAGSARGVRYLAWAAEKHPRQFVREAVKKWLTSPDGGIRLHDHT